MINLSGQRFFNVIAMHHTHTHNLPTRRYIWEDELMCAEEYEKQRAAVLATDPEQSRAQKSCSSKD